MMMMMTKVWNDTSWSDRDFAGAMVGGESVDRWKSRPSDARVTVRKTFTISLSLSL